MDTQGLSPTLVMIIGVAIAAVVSAVVGWALARRRSRVPRQDPYIEALQLLVDNNTDEAFTKLQSSVRSGAAPVDAYIRLGKLLRERGEVHKALQIHQSLTVKTTLTRAEKIELFLNLAANHAALDNDEKVVATLEKAVSNLNIKDPEVFIMLARHQQRLNMSDRAYDTLKQAKKLGGLGDTDLALFLASTAAPLVEKGETREAKKLLQRALKHDEKCAPALLALGDLAEQTGNVDEAIQRWKEVAILSPELAASVLNKLETTLYEKGRFGDIEKVYGDIRSSRWDEAATLALAAFYRKQGRGEDAINLLEDFLQIHPESVRGSLALASFYAKFRDSSQVESFLDRTIDNPSMTGPDKGPSFEFDASSSHQET